MPNGLRYWQVQELAGKPPDAESAAGAESPQVWAKARTCAVHALLGRFCKTILNCGFGFCCVNPFQSFSSLASGIVCQTPIH